MSNASYAGRFKLNIRNMETGEERTTGWFNNLITNAGLDSLGAGPASTHQVALYCRVGSGSTTPAFTDTGLVSNVAEHIGNSATSGYNSTDHYAWRQITYVFTQGATAGNLTEIGTADNTIANSGVLFSRQLILDGSGNPTTLTLLPIEQLTVVYELRRYYSMADVVSTVVINGVTYTITLRPANFNSNNGNQYVGIDEGYFDGAHNGTRMSCFPAGSTLGSINSPPSGSSDALSGYVADGTYSNGTHYREGTYPFATTEGNSAGGIGAFLMPNTSSGDWQGTISPPLPKDATKTASLKFRFTWGRH